MRVVEWSEFIQGENPKPTAMTIGVFDGVHRGHQALMERIVRQGTRPTVVTFRQSPKGVIRPETAGGAILSLPQKLRIFEGLGIFQTILIDFSAHFSTLKGQEFMDLLIRCGNPIYLAIGSNFRCGYQLDMDAALLKERNEARGITTEVVPPVLEGADPISSSRIRKAIAEGDLSNAQAWLGRKVSLDLQGIPAKPAQGGWSFEAASQGRVIPPEGRYEAVVYETNQEKEGKKTEIRITQGNLYVPSGFNAAHCIELISGSQGV